MSYTEPEPDYLASDFDPASVTVPRLRSILVEHNVNYPASAKKPQLIALFNEHVAPQVPHILEDRSRVKRSARGIEDVPSSQASTADIEEAEEEPAPLPTPATARRTTRRTTRSQSREIPDETPVAPRRTTKHGRASDPELDEQPTARRTRHSATPALKEDPEPEAWHRHDEESPFSADNPFQSRSPAGENRALSNDRRRRTTLGTDLKDKRKSSSRRRTEQPRRVVQQDDGIVVPTSKTFDMPVARPKRELTPPSDEGAGEEFTPEEQLELVRERAKTGQKDILPPRRSKKSTSSSGVAKTAPFAILVALLGGFGTVWRQEKVAVGYCGVGKEPSNSLGGVVLPPDLAQTLMPQCENCPPHAFCFPNMETACEDGFILKHHPLSFGGIIPLVPTCEPDGDKARKVKAVADKANEELRERNAKFECGDLFDERGKRISNSAVDEAELQQSMSSKRRRGMSQEEFDALWEPAIGELKERDEIQVSTDGYLAATTEQADTSPSDPPPSPESPYPAQFGEASEKRWRNILATL